VATGDEQYEDLSAAVDGINQDFTTSLSYQPGTLKVLWNGLLREITETTFGWSETGAATFQTSTVPVIGDSIHARYLEA
jgi:hypothetical protein